MVGFLSIFKLIINIFKIIIKDRKFIIGTLLVVIISNQAIQPLFTPRISELTVTPLYIANYDLKGYGLVSKLSYTIDLPLIPWIIGSSRMDLKLPQKKYGDNVCLLTGFIENNPYVYFPDEREFSNSTCYIGLDSKIPIEVTTNAWSVKSLKINLYVFEELDLEVYGDGYKNPSWQSEMITAPIIYSQVQLKQYEPAHIHTILGNENFMLVTDVIRNMGDLEIRGFKLYLDSGIIRVCENDIEISHDSDNIHGEFVYVDLKPRETKRLISVKELPSRYSLRKDRPVYNITTHHECFEISEILKNELTG